MQSKVERSKLLSLPIFGFAQVIKADEIRIFLGAENDSNSLGGLSLTKRTQYKMGTLLCMDLM